MIILCRLMRTDLQQVVDDFLAFSGLKVSEELRDKIRMQAQKQKSYSGKHQNLPLEYFGFSTERLEKDFGFVLKKYGFLKSNA